MRRLLVTHATVLTPRPGTARATADRPSGPSAGTEAAEPAPIGPRGLATAVDYATALAALLLVGVVAAAGRARHRQAVTVGSSGPRARTLVAALVEVPVAVGLGMADAHGGSPGRRTAGVRVVRVDGEAAGAPRCVARSLLKVALPWHLGHQAVWELTSGRERSGAALSAAAHALVLAQAVGAGRRPHRTYADRLTGTSVVPRHT